MAGGQWVRHPCSFPFFLMGQMLLSGLLARAKFYRAVADEAQYIRNRSELAIFSFLT